MGYLTPEYKINFYFLNNTHNSNHFYIYFRKDMINIKRYGGIFNKLISYENIKTAIREVCKLNSYAKISDEILTNEEDYIYRIQNILLSGNYFVSSYWHREIEESGKHRDIYILPIYPDRIVQHAIVQVLEPIWDGILIDQTCACRKDMGIKLGVEVTSRFVSRYEYCVKFDIHHFYQSINHNNLKAVIRHKIKDKLILDLLDKIIDSSENTPGVGIPIGNYISQWFGNIYLDILDRFVKEELHIHGYIRYCDDFIIFGHDFEELKIQASYIRDLIYNGLGMQFSRCDAFPMSEERFVDFLGYQFHKCDMNVYRKMRKRTRDRCMKRLEELLKEHLQLQSMLSVYGSYNGIAILCSGHHFYNSILEMQNMKERIEGYGRISKSIKQ